MLTPAGDATTVLTRLRAICGEDAARLADHTDAVLGQQPRWVVNPQVTDQVAAVLRYAADSQLPTVVRGTGHRLAWGPTPQVALVLDTSRLAGVISYHPDQGTAVVRAGSRLDQLERTFAATGHRLALDPPGPATLGGVIADGAYGPLRMRYGGVGRLVPELVVVRGDGSVTRTECDGLPEPAAGGFGALAVVTEATVRLHPVPAARRWIVRSVASPAEVRLLAGVIARYPEVAAVEVHSPYGQGEGPDLIGVLLEGEAALVADRLPRLCAELAPDAGGIAVYRQPPGWWGRYPFGPDDIALRITTAPSQLYSAGYIIRDGAGETPVRTRWSPGIAVMYAGLPGDTEPARVARLLEGVRQTLIARYGNCVVLDAPPAVRDAVDMWGPLPDAGALRSLKREYDPAGVLAPGRFPSGG